jgi:hypothetical protein
MKVNDETFKMLLTKVSSLEGRITILETFLNREMCGNAR